jgi:hypothetical protein
VEPGKLAGHGRCAPRWPVELAINERVAGGLARRRQLLLELDCQRPQDEFRPRGRSLRPMFVKREQLAERQEKALRKRRPVLR